LDEIGNLPLHLQAKLLSVLEQRNVSPVGSTSKFDIDVRVIAATNLQRSQLNDESRFRQGLLFRLNTVEITLPPLRERREDIAEIATYYADFYCRKYGHEIKGISPSAMQAITQYDWPGNVRALRHAVERAIILSADSTLEAADFSLEAERTPEPVAVDSDDPDLNLDRLEKRTIAHALKLNAFNISRAAKELGLTRAALYRRMEKHGL